MLLFDINDMYKFLGALHAINFIVSLACNINELIWWLLETSFSVCRDYNWYAGEMNRRSPAKENG